MSSLLALSNDLANIVEQVGGAVVSIDPKTSMPTSGIHWRSGIIITSDENLGRSEDITVILSEGRKVSATVLARDSSTDVAVLKLQNVELPVAKIADATSFKVGHLVLALARGNDGNIMAAMGAVSVVSGAWRSMSGGNIDQYIRPDITLYPSFAGGPLVDASGCVVGMNTSGRRGTALTIPASTINRVLDQLLEKGRIARGYLGLGMQPVRLPENLKNTLNLSSSAGVIVVNVEQNGPADQAGVLLGDVLVMVDGIPVNDTVDMLALLNSSTSIGKTVKVQAVRGGALVELAIAIGEKPAK
ncbi:MAG: S1C family serine protease [Heteroscytonema crispum UTEX LB 1556]